MKIKVILSVLILFAGVGGAFAQEVEQDDMYFNSKDRAKLREAQKASDIAYASAKKSKTSEAPAEENFNPTDSYSARNVNPEYTSRSHSQTAKEDDEDYFVSNYQYNQRNRYNNWNNSFNNWYGNSWYAPSYWGGMNAWNNPYYGSYYDSWGSPWGNPYYRSGWSTSFSYGWGNGWNMGFGNCWGCNPYYNSWNPYYGYASYWNSPYYNNWGWGGYGYYPGRVIVVESGDRYQPAYGKRNSRSSQLNREDNRSSGRYSNRTADVSERERPNSGGRVDNSSSRQPDYYNNAWRMRQNSNNSYSRPTDSRPSSFGNSQNSGNSRSSWESSHRSTGSSPSYSPSQSRSSGFDGGSRSGGSSSGGGSGSRSSRSRGN